jgi:excisionase family DNA binding protein
VLPVRAVRGSVKPFQAPFGPPVVRMLTVREVAAALQVSTATVYALCERGELPHLRVSNAIRVTPADLAAFVTGRRR